MWRPLDIEVGEPARIKRRLDQIEAKLDQAEETCSYLQSRRVGAGFDYRDVKSFIPVVVSPFIEWLPSISERYWISACGVLIQAWRAEHDAENALHTLCTQFNP